MLATNREHVTSFKDQIIVWTEYFTAQGGNMDKIKWKLFKISNK